MAAMGAGGYIEVTKKRKNAGEGYGYMFSGAFAKKSDAVKKEKKRKGSFVKAVMMRSGMRYAVMTPRTNPIKRKKKVKPAENPSELLVMAANPTGAKFQDGRRGLRTKYQHQEHDQRGFQRLHGFCLPLTGLLASLVASPLDTEDYEHDEYVERNVVQRVAASAAARWFIVKIGSGYGDSTARHGHAPNAAAILHAPAQVSMAQLSRLVLRSCQFPARMINRIHSHSGTSFGLARATAMLLSISTKFWTWCSLLSSATYLSSAIATRPKALAYSPCSHLRSSIKAVIGSPTKNISAVTTVCHPGSTLRNSVNLCIRFAFGRTPALNSALESTQVSLFELGPIQGRAFSIFPTTVSEVAA